VRLYPPGPSYYDEVEVELVGEMLDRGYSVEQVSKAVLDLWTYPSRNAAYYRNKARNHVLCIQEDRWNWNTSRDQMTMDRAFNGSQPDWDELNHYERREVVLRLQYLLDNDLRHPMFPELKINEGGLSAWCNSVGLDDPQHITNAFGRRERARRANAEAKANACINA
jgi:hypothetical protein